MTQIELIGAIVMATLLLALAVSVVVLGILTSRRKWHEQRADSLGHPSAIEHEEAHRYEAYDIRSTEGKVAIILFVIATGGTVVMVIVPLLKILFK